MHFPSGPDKSIWDYKSDLFCLAAKFYKKDKYIKNDLIVANSEFTKYEIIKCYNLPSNSVNIVYPPVDEENSIFKKQRKQVVSLGRFAPDKRQLEQIMIAQKLRSYRFYIVGFVNSKEYYSLCKKYIKNNNINNVTLVPDASKNEMVKLLSNSSYFIHSLRNEPFGITAVQAIQNNIIPIVHDSGGQREIVPFSNLRYSNIKGAVKVFNYLSHIPNDKKQFYISELKSHIKIFSSDNFDRKFKKLINKKLNISKYY
tara:strand:+ start:159 stop:926 length:768 start_codon:yes stop_codon:yes gene_type:complete